MIRKSKSLYLIGAGGLGKQLCHILKKDKFFNIVKFVDDQHELNIVSFLKKKNLRFTITIGNTNIREKIYLKSLKTNLKYSTIILSKKNIYTKNINKGCIIEFNTVITNNVSLGIGNLVMTGSVIGHDVSVGNFCNIGCNTTISGGVIVSNHVQIGANSFISNDVKICSNTIIVPGSTVLSDIKVPGIYKDNLKVN